MRITVTLDDALYEKALEMADPGMEKSELFRVAIETFIRVQTARRIATRGGSMPDLVDIPRRRGASNEP
ncbi:MAG TPA: type II toxin-antitoxin system VapB family antitoxin [Paraburkholderia sp.]|uniref:type II toxin-antitoxin system VapB family antitoxin n=1 Tax=Paraburkholderia sp. TaxID=1926495 RepID=UPI002DECFC9D|nr:type II toxin-antitoxin system VapB family antitoxin [Paraburkholderia sp.]